MADLVRRLELNWDPQIYPRTDDRIARANADITASGPDNVVGSLDNVDPRVVWCSRRPAPSADVGQFAVVYAEVPYAKLERDLKTRSLVVGTTAVNQEIRIGVAAWGQRLGSFEGKPAVAIKLNRDTTLAFLAILGPWRYRRLPTYGINSSDNSAGNTFTLAFTEQKLHQVFGDSIPIVEPRLG
jgi:hypothetical protein